jgi:hypothetical protein
VTATSYQNTGTVVATLVGGDSALRSALTTAVTNVFQAGQWRADVVVTLAGGCAVSGVTQLVVTVEDTACVPAKVSTPLQISLSVSTDAPSPSPTPGPTVVAALACSNGTDSRVDRTTACPYILFLNHGGSSYSNHGTNLFDALKNYVDGVLKKENHQCAGKPYGVEICTGIENLPADLSMYTQVWSYDLDATSAPEPTVNIPKWQSMAQWFHNGYPSQRQHIILDGRILSSPLKRRYQLFYNYFENLRARGGGLMLGTDHGGWNPNHGSCGGFTCGTNDVTAALNIGNFFGNFVGGQGIAYADAGAPVMSWPLDATLSTASNSMTSYTCTDAALCVVGTVFDRFLWDHTSTSQSAVGVQPNGMTFYAAAFHSEDTDKPAISSTIRGLLNFQISIIEPACDRCYAVGESATLVASVHVPSVAPYVMPLTRHFLLQQCNAVLRRSMSL